MVCKWRFSSIIIRKKLKKRKVRNRILSKDDNFCKVAPFVGNDDGGVDGAGEGDVVEGVEQLGEDVSVHNRVVVQGPPPHWDNFANLENAQSLHTSDNCVVEEDKDDEGGVEEGEGNEELVEGVAHLASWTKIRINLRCKYFQNKWDTILMIQYSRHCQNCQILLRELF